MERTELLKKIHDLKSQQQANKKLHISNCEELAKVKQQVENAEKEIWKKAEEEHRTKMKSIQEKYSEQVKLENDNYSKAQWDIERQIVDVKCEYFKDHPLEPIN